MMRTFGFISTLIWICLALPSLAQSSTAQVEVGFQSQDLQGNSDIYRSQVNEDEGLLLRAFSFQWTRHDGEPSFFDRLRVNASGFGATPHGRFDLQADKAAWYRLRLEISQADHFNALLAENPSQAAIQSTNNPWLLRQHTTDRSREWGELSLEFLPQAKLRPILGFRWNTYDGPASTTYHLGGDEFQLQSRLDEEETEFRAGLKYVDKHLDAEVVYGWRDLESDETRTATMLAGNSTRPILGQDIFLEDLEGRTNSDASTEVLDARLRVFASETLSFLANYVDIDPESELREDAVFSGTFASFRINRFFTRGTETLRTRTEAPSWRGDVKAEWAFSPGFEASVGVMRRNLELDGNALLDTLYLDSVTFSNGDPRDIREQITAETRLDREEDVVDLQLGTTRLANFRFWAGFRQASQDIRVDQSLAEIVVPGGQEGAFQRDIDRLQVGAQFRKKGHQASLTFSRDDADQAVVRTDFLDRDVLLFRGRTQLIEKKLFLSANGRWVTAENPTAGIDFDLDQFTGNIALSGELHALFGFDIDYGVFDLETRTDYRDPLFLDKTSFHKEDGVDLGIGLHGSYQKCGWKGSYRSYDNDGLLAFDLNRTQLGVTWSFTEAFQAILEATRVEYNENTEPLANYDVDQFALLLRWQK